MQDVDTDDVAVIDETQLHDVIAQAIKTNQNSQGWAKVTLIGATVKQYFGVGSQSLGYRTFADFLASLQGYELQKQGRIWQVRIAA